MPFFFNSISIGILLLLICLLLYHIPVFIIYCNQLGIFKPYLHPVFEGGQFESKAKQAQLYFLHDEELISTEVNDALEMVSFFLSKF